MLFRSRREVTLIALQRLVRVDGKVRTDINFPAGFMDVVSIEKTKEHFRLLYDTKGRFSLHRIPDAETEFKLCRVRRTQLGAHGIPYVVTHDGRTIRYPDPLIKANDTVKFNLKTNKIDSFVKFDVGCLVTITGGRNLGRIGVLEHREKHMGGFEIAHVKDAKGHKFVTRVNNVFVIGKRAQQSLISLPKQRGIKLSILEERERRTKKWAKRNAKLKSA